MELSRNPNNRVTVVTRIMNRSAIQQFFLEEPQPENLEFWYMDLPRWTYSWWEVTSPIEHIYYFFWQIALRRFVKQKMKKGHTFDLIHHITLGLFRTPVFLGNLGIPFAFGPIGGGEKAPFRLLKGVERRSMIKDMLRHTVNVVSSYNPLLRRSFRQSSVILCKTSETQNLIPKRYQSKSHIALELGIPEARPAVHRETGRRARKLLYVGRMEYWKGIHLGIEAFARLRTTQPEVEFTIIGGGSDLEWLKSKAQEHGVLDHIQWIDRVPQARLFQMYQDYDLLLFPSMHDSSGGVVLESLHFGLPVICLDLGGPKEILDEQSGLVVSTHKKNESEVVDGLVEAVSRVIDDVPFFVSLQEGALARAAQFTWPKVVAQTYQLIASSQVLPDQVKPDILVH